MSWPWLDDRELCETVNAETFWLPKPIVAYKAIDPFLNWPTGQSEKAECRRGAYMLDRRSHQGETVPAVECTCGFYAWKTLEQAIQHAAVRNGFDVWKVELTGLVIEHEHGWRSEFITLAERLQPRDPLRVLAELGQGTTGQIRQTCGADARWVRSCLQRAADRGLCVEIPTEKPNNHGGHLWLWLGETVEPVAPRENL